LMIAAIGLPRRIGLGRDRLVGWRPLHGRFALGLDKRLRPLRAGAPPRRPSRRRRSVAASSRDSLRLPRISTLGTAREWECGEVDGQR
jgi:hypothetical protein